MELMQNYTLYTNEKSFCLKDNHHASTRSHIFLIYKTISWQRQVANIFAYIINKDLVDCKV